MEPHEALKRALLHGFNNPPKDRNPDMLGVIQSMRILLEQDTLKTFYASAREAQREELHIADFLMGVVQFSTLQIALLMRGDGKMLPDIAVDALILLFHNNLLRSIELVSEISKKEK